MYYRKYRPQKFSEISKPNQTAEALMNQVSQGKTGHAYLFYGPRGTGKTTTARILSKALNCLKLDESGDPCGKCEFCKSITSGTFMDLIEIDAASNRGIDDIRDLKDKIKLAPSRGNKKIYIVDEVHMLTNEAFNALLKTLEEPPAHVVFILATTEFHKVPETIRSRCQVFKFKRASRDQLVKRLEGISKSEKAKVSKEDLSKIADASLGGFRDAETLLQQVVEGSLEVDSLLNAGTVHSYISFVDSLLASDTRTCFAQINKVYEEGIDLHVWTGELLKYLRDLLFISSGAGEDMVPVPEEVLLSMKDQTERISTSETAYYIEVISKAHNQIKSSFITQLPLELAVVALTGSGNDEDMKAPEPSAGNSKKKEQQENSPVKEVKEAKKTAIKEEEEEVAEEDSAPDSEVPEDSEDNESEIKTDVKSVIDIDSVKDNWDKVLKLMSVQNSSIQALLKKGNPLSVEGDRLVLEVFYTFHKERLESVRNRKMVETAFEETYGHKMKLKCVVSQTPPPKKSDKEVGELTDYNVVMPSVTDGSDPLEIFDGGLPLG